MGRFRSSGYEAAATEAKKQSISTCKMQRSVVHNTGTWEGLIKGEVIKLYSIGKSKGNIEMDIFLDRSASPG